MADVETKKVQIELEVDTNTVNSGLNPYQKWIFAARAVDAWRIFPRLFFDCIHHSSLPSSELVYGT